MHKPTESECFNNVLRDEFSETKIIPPWWDTGLIGTYKFYLAFENAFHCTDYVSEKFWRNSLRAGAVPIVYGPNKENVEQMAPPHSFIFAEDFKNPADLVKYINYLNKNDTAYLGKLFNKVFEYKFVSEYHAWRKIKINKHKASTYAAPERNEQMVCDLCKEVHKRRAAGWAKKTIPSVASWWWLDQQDDRHGVKTSFIFVK